MSHVVPLPPFFCFSLVHIDKFIARMQRRRMYHSPDYVEQLPAGSHLGPLDPNTAKDMALAKSTSTQSVPTGEDNTPPHLSLCVRVSDFEAPAKAILSNKSWVYASATANSGQSMRRNLDDWSLISFRPRVL